LGACNQVKYSLDGTSWAYTTTLYPTATPTPRHIGHLLLSRRQSYRCGLYIVLSLPTRSGSISQGARAELDCPTVSEVA